MTNPHRPLDAIRRDLSAARTTQAACAQFSSAFHAAKRMADSLSAELANAECAARTTAQTKPARATTSAPSSAKSLPKQSNIVMEPAEMRTDADIQALADVAISCGTHLHDATWVMQQFASLTVDRTTAQGLLQHYANHPNSQDSQLSMRSVDPRIEDTLISSTTKLSQGKALAGVQRLATNADDKRVDMVMDHYLKLRGHRD